MDRASFRLLEPPLGPLAVDSPKARADLAELLAEFDRQRSFAPPNYAEITLRKAFRERACP